MMRALKTVWFVILWPFRYLQDVLFPVEKIIYVVAPPVFLKAGCEYQYRCWAKGSDKFGVLIVIYNKLARRYLQEDGTFSRTPIHRNVNSDTYKEIVINFTPRYTGYYAAGTGAPPGTEKLVVDDESLKKNLYDDSRWVVNDDNLGFEAWKSVE